MRKVHLMGRVLVLLALVSCEEQRMTDTPLWSADGTEVRAGELLQESEATVIFFLAPGCPLCHNYAPVLRSFAEKYSNSTQLQLLGVMSGTAYGMAEMQEYLSINQLPLKVWHDPSKVLAGHFGATITPEAVLTNPEGEVIYRGAIDNWAVSLGRKRRRPTEHYLAMALHNHLSGRAVDPKITTAVGCFIE